jgi:hypothetical protein
MLLRTALLCLFFANLAVSQFAEPEILEDYDPGTFLEPMSDRLEARYSAENLHIIRDLLEVRQNQCPTGYPTACNNPSGRSAL